MNATALRLDENQRLRAEVDELRRENRRLRITLNEERVTRLRADQPRQRVEKRTALELMDHLEFASGLDVVDMGHGRWKAQCPAHEDKTPSLSVRELGDGTVLVHDFGGCTTEQVLESIGWHVGMLRAAK